MFPKSAKTDVTYTIQDKKHIATNQQWLEQKVTTRASVSFLSNIFDVGNSLYVSQN